MWNDLRKLLTGSTLYRLDVTIGDKLVPAFYALGLAAVGLWAIDHLFATFAFSFGQGLWGILEIVVYGSLAVVILRIAAELVLIGLRGQQGELGAARAIGSDATLLDDVSEAIRDLAGEEEDDEVITPATDPAPFATPPAGGPDLDPQIKVTAPRRTAKRTPKAKEP
jgi:hypothetical protein